MTEQQKTPAGWYPHPEMSGTLAYWDGQQWTEKVAPMTAPPQKSVSSLTIAGGVILGLAVVLVALFLIYGVVTSDDGLECANRNAERALDGLPPLDCD